MKVVMLLVVRDDIDVVDAQIAFHLNAGVDLVLATDHDSADGTSEVLEAYSSQGYLHRLPEQGEARDDEWRTRMADLAIREYAADWIIDSSVDEFWLPRAGSLGDVLAAIPPRYGVVQALRRVFLPRPDDPRDFDQRLIVRRPITHHEDESLANLEWMLRPIQRASTDVAVVGTRQDVLDGRVPLRAWYPVEVLTFPLRSREHAERRVRGRSGSTVPRSVVEQRMFEADRLGRLPDSWSEVVVDDEAMQQGIEAGSYVLDTRLRDALRGIAPEGGSYSLASKEAGLMDLRVPTVTEDLEYAEECIALREVDVESVLHRVQALEDRIIALEGSLLRRAGRRMSRILRR